MMRKTRHFHGLLVTATIVAGVAALLVSSGRPAWTDDRDLLKFDTSKPYLMIILDTSASMALEMGPGNVWVPGGADNPDSRLYQAKQAMHDVFDTVTDVHFAFAGYNQDRVRVVAKHWLYFLHPTVSVPGSWPINFPRPDIGPKENGQLTFHDDTLDVDIDGDGIPDAGDGNPDTWIGDIGGDVLTFGPHFCSDPSAPMLVDCSSAFQPVGTAGTCFAPLDLDDPTGRAQVQSFAIAGTPTTFWIAEAGTVYRLQATVGVPTDIGVDKLGVIDLAVDFVLDRVAGCTGPFTANFDQNSTFSPTLTLDAHLNQFLMVDDAPGAGNPPPGGPPPKGDDEGFAGLWAWTDVISEGEFGTARPHTGLGWEGNYDAAMDSTGDPAFDALLVNTDPYSCLDPNDLSTCLSVIKPAVTTTVAKIDGVHVSPLDSGDMLPLDWNNENRIPFLHRLAPNLAGGASAPDFRGASYFVDAPDANGLLQLAAPGERPLLAVDLSPMAKALVDVRCWYTGDAANKCKDSAYYDRGWEAWACEYDSEFGCRKPFIIVVSDGEANTGQEDPTSDIANLNSKAGIQTWAINLGDPDACDSGGTLHPITQAGKGECVTPQTRSELLAALRDILGQIRESARSFASAAVPTVQAAVEQKIFLTSFTPLQDESVWDGHVNAFIKPLPVDADDRPDTSIQCTPSQQSACFLWDAGAVLLTTPDNAADQNSGELGDSGKRRVFYSRLNTAGTSPNQRELFNPPDAATAPEIRYDLWEALGIPYAPDTPGPVPDPAALARSIAVITETLAVKSSTIDVVDPDTGDITSVPIDYLLGDIFHATPLVLGGPPSTQNFAADLFTDEGDPTADCEAEDAPNERPANTGYRCFFRRHQNRRRQLFVGSNDGMVHVFDSGRFHHDDNFDDPFTDRALVDLFDEGTGHEVFAFMPREVMPTVTALAEGIDHDWTVDGPVAAVDAFIDPKFDVTGPDPDHRQWRTVAVGGLREGGRAYYALDVTQPDRLTLDPIAGIFVPDDDDDYDVPSCLSDHQPADCGPLAYPSLLWEFTDSVFDPGSGQMVRLDEDFDPVADPSPPGSGIADLGDTWSTASLGRIQVCAENGTACKPDDPDPLNRADVLEIFVAVFGGGMDVDGKDTPEAATRGDWLYMVDIETGQVIYKRQLDGAVTSEVAAVDTDQDGVLDRIYTGTLAGRLYRVDLTPDSNGDVPALEDVGPVPGLDGLMHDVPLRVPDTEWVPRVLFDTLAPKSAAEPGILVRRPLYQRPSVFFVAKLGLYGLAVGTGDREDLWSIAKREERFYVFVDDTTDLSPPLTEDSFQRVDLGDGLTSSDFLLDPAAVPGTRGWFLVMNEEERIITDAFSLSGITIFSSFRPRTDVTDDKGDPVNVGCGEKPGDLEDRRCARLGNSSIFAVNTTNANGFLQDAMGDRTRSVEVSTFVSNPFTEPGGSKNPDDPDGGATADDLDQRLLDIMESLMALFPKNCKFANYRIDVKTVAADTSMQFIAPIPVCIVDKNWKEY